jgi:hypothetical protein
MTTGGYWYHKHRRAPHGAAEDRRFRDQLLEALAEETGTAL